MAKLSRLPSSQPARQAERCSLPLVVRGSAPGSSRTITRGATMNSSDSASRTASQIICGFIRRRTLRLISSASPTPSLPNPSVTGKAAMRPRRSSSTRCSSACSRSCG
ncbi:hypothetical protein D9M71_106200 [compost metagenome]